MIAALLVLALQDVRVQKVERLAVDLVRPLSWSPLAVTYLHSAYAMSASMWYCAVPAA